MLNRFISSFATSCKTKEGIPDTINCLPLIFTLANIALPTTSSFVGEFLILSGIYKTNVITGIIAALGVILSGAYSLWLYNKVTFGNLKVNFLIKFQDMYFKEFFIMFPLFIYIVILGIFPSYFTQNLHFVVNALCFI